MEKDTCQKGNSKYVNKLNKIKILKLIREHENISRADLSKTSGISAPTVTRIVDSLINEKRLVREIGEGVSKGGRKPTLLEFAGQDNFVIGIDLGTTHIYGVLSNLNAEIIAEITCPTHVHKGFSEIMAKTSEIINRLLDNPKIQRKKIFGVGLAVAGLINQKKNIVEYSPDFRWTKVNILEELQKNCSLPIIFDNVTRVMALGELWYGIGSKVKNFIMVNVGYGIGAGIIMNGKPFYGPHGIAAEFGHVTIDKDSKVQCECGNYGCLEALASGRSIALCAKRRLENGEESALERMSEGNFTRITAKMVFDAARNGDKLAMEISDTAIEYLGIGIAGLVNLFSPEAILLGGGVSQSGSFLFEKVNKIVRERSLSVIVRDIEIKPATLGKRAAVKGAIALILSKVLNLKNI